MPAPSAVSAKTLSHCVQLIYDEYISAHMGITHIASNSSQGMNTLTSAACSGWESIRTTTSLM